METTDTRVEGGDAGRGITGRVPPALGRYVVRGVLGQGGMGVVYEAHDPELDRTVAIKLLRRAGGGGSDADRTSRLLREAQAMAKISHPNVLQVFEAGTHEGQVYIVIEFVEGETLRAWCRREGRTWQEMRALFLQIGEGLAAAHAAGIIHRDLKPDNILVDVRGRARVMDFGLARSAHAASEADESAASLADSRAPSSSSLDMALTEPGAVVGTPEYMPIEQLAGQAIDARCDQFSFCVTMWEALHGVRPFTGRDRVELAHAIARGVPREPPLPSSPAWLRAAILRGLAAAPDARYPSIAALMAAIRADPRARLARALLVVAGALLVVVGVYGFVLAARVEMAACDGGAAEIAEVWRPDRAEAVTAAFVATGRPHAELAASRVRAALDRRAAAWAAGHEDACETTRRGEQSPEMLDRRMVCLDRARDGLAALVELFVAADAQVVDRADAALAELADPAACADLSWLVAAVPPPEDPTARAAVRVVHGELDVIRLQERAGRLVEALAAIPALHERALALGYPPLVAETALVRGRLHNLREESGEAERWVWSALWTAEAHRHDEVVVKAWIELVRLYGDRMGRFEEAERWAAGAAASLARIGDPPPLRAELFKIRGNAALAALRLEEALARYQEALRLYSELFGAESIEVAAVMNNVANVLQKQEKVEEARAMHRAALALRERLLGPTHPDVATSCINFGVALDDPEESLALYERAEAIWRASFGPRSVHIARAKTNAANVWIQRGELARAEALFSEALAILVEVQPTSGLTGDVRSNLAALRGMMGQFSRAIATLADELAAREARHGADDLRTVSARLNLAGLYVHRGDRERGLALLQQNLALLAAAPEARRSWMFTARVMMMEVLLLLRRVPEAGAMYDLAVSSCAGQPEAQCEGLAYYGAMLALARRDPKGALRELERHDAGTWRGGNNTIFPAWSRFVRAQALWDARGDRAAARALAAEALTRLEAFPEFDPARVAEVRAWLAARR